MQGSSKSSEAGAPLPLPFSSKENQGSMKQRISELGQVTCTTSLRHFVLGKKAMPKELQEHIEKTGISLRTPTGQT